MEKAIYTYYNYTQNIIYKLYIASFLCFTYHFLSIIHTDP